MWVGSLGGDVLAQERGSRKLKVASGGERKRGIKIHHRDREAEGDGKGKRRRERKYRECGRVSGRGTVVGCE